MRLLGWFLLCVFLGRVSSFAAADDKVNVVFQHAPKRSRHFDEILKRAEAGDRAAQFQAGLAFETGAGTEQDYSEAAKWYHKAADAGDPAAQNNLGGMFLRGLGVEQNDGEALRWYLRAAGEGHLAAQNNVGFMNAAGRGTRANDQDAIRWYRTAAEKGYAPAQANLGFMYSQGRGVPRDGNEAVRWYRMATAQSYAPAEYKLGLLYYEGGVIAQDVAEAMRWFHKAVVHGSAAAETRSHTPLSTARACRKATWRLPSGIASPPSTDCRRRGRILRSYLRGWTIPLRLIRPILPRSAWEGRWSMAWDLSEANRRSRSWLLADGC